MLPTMRAFRSFGTEPKHEDRGADPDHGHGLFRLMETGSWNELRRKLREAVGFSECGRLSQKRRFGRAQQD